MNSEHVNDDKSKHFLLDENIEIKNLNKKEIDTFYNQSENNILNNTIGNSKSFKPYYNSENLGSELDLNKT